MGARRPKPTALKERTSVRPQIGLSRLFSAANQLVPFHKHQDTIVRDLKLAPPQEDDKTVKLENQRPPEPPAAANDKTVKLELELAQNSKPLLDLNRKLEPLPQIDKEVLARALDPAKDSAYEPTKSLTAPSEESYGTVVRVPNAKKKRKPPKIKEELDPRTSITKLKKQEAAQKSSDTRMQALFFLVPAIGLVTYALVSSELTPLSQQPVARESKLTPQQIEDRLNYYRMTTGTKLNRDRINVQMQNFKQAPDLSVTDHKVKPPNIMDGLPLKGEPNNFARKPDLPYDPTYSEAKIGYGLQEEQDRQRFEQQAKEAWVNEFIENARKDGYEVKIDKFGNVKAKAIPKDELGPVDDD